MAEFLPHKNLSVRETSHKTTCSLCKYLCLVLVIFFFLVPDAASQKWLGGFVHWWGDSRGQGLLLLVELQCLQQSLAKSRFDHVPGSSYGMLVIHALWFPLQLYVPVKSCLGAGLFSCLLRGQLGFPRRLGRKSYMWWGLWVWEKPRDVAQESWKSNA